MSVTNDPLKVKQAMKRIDDSTGLVISRVPQKVKKGFKALANSDFEGDYGFTLKHIWDFYMGALILSEHELAMEIESLKERVSVLEQKPLASEKDTIKLGDGTELEVKRK